MSVVARSEVREGVELIELDDPDRYNALTAAMVGELRDGVRRPAIAIGRCGPW